MNTIGTAALSATFLLGIALTQPAIAMPVGNLHEATGQNAASISKVDFLSGQEIPFGASYRLDRLNPQTAQAAAESYFDFDAIITLGTIALAGGGLAAAGFSAARRGSSKNEADAGTDRGWRAVVLQALEEDLTRYARTFRRAA